MARAKKKTDEPSYRMIIENGKLVPAFPFDAEKLDTWRNGTRVLVTFSHDADRPLIRKWWGILGVHMKGGNTPWEDKEAASAAIKLALGMIDVAKLPEEQGGGWLQYGRSLTEYNDAELEQHVEKMRALLYRITGIDDEAVYRESLGASHDDDRFVPDYPEPESSDNPPAPPSAESDEGRGPAEVSTPSTSGGATADQSHAKATEDNAALSGHEGATGGPGVASRLSAGRTADGAGAEQSAASATNTDPAEARTPAIMPDAEAGSAGEPASNSDAGATIRYFYAKEADLLVTTADGSHPNDGTGGDDEIAELTKEEFDKLEKEQEAAAKKAKAAAKKNAPRAKGDLNGADAAWLLGLARRLVAATEPKSGRQYVHLLAAAAQDAKDNYPPGGIGEKTKEVAKQIYNLCFDIAIGTVPMDMKVIATLAGGKVADLKTPEPKQ